MYFTAAVHTEGSKANWRSVHFMCCEQALTFRQQFDIILRLTSNYVNVALFVVAKTGGTDNVKRSDVNSQ